jgi:hypothetical protein
MVVHLFPVSTKGNTCTCLASFTQDAERSLAALYYCVRETYDERAAHSTAETWLQILEERLEESSDLPDLTSITAAAIALFVSNIVISSAGHALDSPHREALSQHRRRLASL